MVLRLRFISAACDKCEEMHVGLIVGVCKARSKFGCSRCYLSGQGGFWILVRLWHFVREFQNSLPVSRTSLRKSEREAGGLASTYIRCLRSAVIVIVDKFRCAF